MRNMRPIGINAGSSICMVIANKWIWRIVCILTILESPMRRRLDADTWDGHLSLCGSTRNDMIAPPPESSPAALRPERPSKATSEESLFCTWLPQTVLSKVITREAAPHCNIFCEIVCRIQRRVSCM